MAQKRVFVFMWVWLASIAAASAQTSDSYARGELLYSTHCISCHGSQLHWRERKVAQDWAGLRAEVGRWQSASGLGWSEEDVTDVARYLNTLYYRFPAPDLSRSSTGSTTKLTHQ